MLEYFGRTEESGIFLYHLHSRHQSGSYCTFTMYFRQKRAQLKFMHKRLVSLCLFSMLKTLLLCRLLRAKRVYVLYNAI